MQQLIQNNNNFKNNDCKISEHIGDVLFEHIGFEHINIKFEHKGKVFEHTGFVQICNISEYTFVFLNT